MTHLSRSPAAPASCFAFLCLGLASAAAGCAAAEVDSLAGDPAGDGAVLTTSVVTAGANVVLNEILANEPGSDVSGEFIELVNIGSATADLTGWTLSDAVMVRHTFIRDTSLAPGSALVVFGGASAIPAGVTNAVAASTGSLGLNNTGDTVTLASADGTARVVVTYASSLASADGVSMNLSPEGSTSTSYVLHNRLVSASSSPGVRTTGAPWSAPASSNHRLPQLRDHGGVKLTSPRIVTIIATNDALSADLFGFSERLPTSQWWRTMQQAYGLGAATSVNVVGPAISGRLTNDQMIAYIQNVIAAAGLTRDGRTFYMLYLPDGSGNAGPFPFEAYHSTFPDGGSDAWGVITRVFVYGGGETQLQAMTRVASHEIIEAVTDPQFTGWLLDPPGAPISSASPWQVEQPGEIENADLCEGARWFEGSDEYQRVWSNTAAATGGDPCVPARAGVNLGTLADVDWHPITASSRIDVPVTGWAPAATGNWLVMGFVFNATGNFAPMVGQNIFMSSPLGKDHAPCFGAGMNRGVVATLPVTAPANVVSGDYAVIQIQSFRVDPATCFPDPHGDQYQMSLTGVFVP
jgi:hypothetical protein